MTEENPVFAAAQTLSKNLQQEINKLKDVDQLHDFERRTKSLTAMSKAVQAFNELIQELKSNSKEDDGTIESVVEFRDELAQRIKTLVDK